MTWCPSLLLVRSLCSVMGKLSYAHEASVHSATTAELKSTLKCALEHMTSMHIRSIFAKSFQQPHLLTQGPSYPKNTSGFSCFLFLKCFPFSSLRVIEGAKQFFIGPKSPPQTYMGMKNAPKSAPEHLAILSWDSATLYKIKQVDV